MKGFDIFINAKTEQKFVQIDVKKLLKKPQKFQERIDVLIAEERKSEKSISWDKAKKKLRA